MSEVVDLILELEINGSEFQEISLPFQRDTQKRIDEETIVYATPADYFLEKKKIIAAELNKDSSRVIPEHEIQLKEIYIKQKNKKRIALFQSYKYQDYRHQICIVPLSVLIKNQLFNGQAILLYQLDKQAQNIENYQSIFSKMPTSLINKLELGIITKPCIEELWKYLVQNEDFGTITRFLLMEETVEEKAPLFQEITEMRTINQKEKIGNGCTRKKE